MLTFSADGYKINFAGNELMSQPAQTLNQQHTNVILTTFSGDMPADGIILPREDASSVALRTADCAPIILLAATRIALIHAGWRGLANGIINEAVAHFVPGEIEVAVVGPSAHSCCYAFQGILPPHGVSDCRDGVQYLSIYATASRQLEAAAITVKTIDHCTICSKNFHSYRRDGNAAGRNWSWVVEG